MFGTLRVPYGHQCFFFFPGVSWEPINSFHFISFHLILQTIVPEYNAKFVETLWFTRPLTEFRFLPFIIGLEINQSDVHKNHTYCAFSRHFHRHILWGEEEEEEGLYESPCFPFLCIDQSVYLALIHQSRRSYSSTINKHHTHRHGIQEDNNGGHNQ